MKEERRQVLERCQQVDETAILFEIAADQSVFYLSRDYSIMMPVGYESVSARFFRHTPPSADELEYGINYIEDEIAKVVHSIPSQSCPLFTDTAFVRSLALLCAIPDTPVISLSTRQLENLFGQYAEIIVGRPPRQDEPDISPVFYAQLLILREFMHHFQVGEIRII